LCSFTFRELLHHPNGKSFFHDIISICVTAKLNLQKGRNFFSKKICLWKTLEYFSSRQILINLWQSFPGSFLHFVFAPIIYYKLVHLLAFAEANRTCLGSLTHHFIASHLLTQAFVFFFFWVSGNLKVLNKEIK
jgi:hypothetical protein